MIHIVFEGLDGTGKSTLIKEVYQKLHSEGSFCKWIYQTKEPGLDTTFQPGVSNKRPGVDLREIVLNNKSLTPLEKELLFYVDASQHRRFIEAQDKAIVISDRGLWSHYAYLYGMMKTTRLNWEEYKLLKSLINLVCPKPDAVVYLKGDLALMSERLGGKEKDSIESLGEAFYENVENQYEDLAANPQSLLLTLNARNSIDNNMQTVVQWLKDNFSYEELITGCRQLSET
jgi:dTMP kinase